MPRPLRAEWSGGPSITVALNKVDWVLSIQSGSPGGKWSPRKVAFLRPNLKSRPSEVGQNALGQNFEK